MVAERFQRMADATAHAVGTVWAFGVALLSVLVWIATGPSGTAIMMNIALIAITTQAMSLVGACSGAALPAGIKMTRPAGDISDVSMNVDVFAPCDNLKVRQAVIRFVAVDVMDKLCWFQRTTKRLFHNKTMFVLQSPSRCTNQNVSGYMHLTITHMSSDFACTGTVFSSLRRRVPKLFVALWTDGHTAGGRGMLGTHRRLTPFGAAPESVLALLRHRDLIVSIIAFQSLKCNAGVVL